MNLSAGMLFDLLFESSPPRVGWRSVVLVVMYWKCDLWLVLGLIARRILSILTFIGEQYRYYIGKFNFSEAVTL